MSYLTRVLPLTELCCQDDRSIRNGASGPGGGGRLVPLRPCPGPRDFSGVFRTDPGPGPGLEAAGLPASVFDQRGFYRRDGIRPIYDPGFIPALHADLAPSEMVMAVEIDGESHAYPISVHNSREIVNDVVGGRPILVTW